MYRPGSSASSRLRYTGSRWRVTIWVDPQKPGGYVIVEVSSSGKILNYSPGY